MRRSLTRTGLLAAVTATVLAVLAVPASAQPQGTVRNAGGTTAVADSYIVVLQDSAALRSAGVAETARRLATARRGSVDFVYQRAITGFATTMSSAEARVLAADPAVAYVEQNHTVTASGVQPNPPAWGLDRIDQRTLPLDNSYTYPSTASRVHAYIVDTGVRLTHTTFGGRAVSGYDAVDNDFDASDCNGHGTHVAGTVGGTEYGVAKGVQIVAVRVLNCAGSGTDAQVIAGVDWVTANAIAPAVANMSLGGSASTALDSAVAGSIAAGVTYGIAAGNGNVLGSPRDACGFSPARVPAAITVGATQRDDTRASFSNYGTCLDIFAPGVDITSSWNTDDTATKTIGGTSMATPHVVGAAALYLAAKPAATPAQVTQALTTRATPGKVVDARTGSPNLLLYVGARG